METSAGATLAELELGAAPVSSCNFLRYAQGGYYDGGRFFRSVRSEDPGDNPVPIDVIQAEAKAGEEFGHFGPGEAPPCGPHIFHRDR